MRIKMLVFTMLFSILCFSIVGQAQLAKGQSKYFGNIMSTSVPSDFVTYWNQVTLQWLGKWAHIQPTQGSWNWSFIDTSYNYAKSNGMPYKEHTFIWSIEDPSWISALSSTQRIQAIQTWMQTFCQRYPNVDLIDVVNEPLHTRPTYAEDLGGNGTTGWDWVIKSFEYARQYCPNAKLLINDYNIEAFEQSTLKYLQIINLLKSRNLIDGIGLQCHQLQGAGTIPILKNLFKLAQTGLPIHISELDLFSANDTDQLNMYKKLFPLLYEHPAVKGVTLWGYNNGLNSGLKNGSTQRAALTWLRTQYFNSTVNKGPKAFWTNTALGLTINFSGSKSWDFDGSLSSYSWNFGDGTTGTGSTVSHTYTAVGTYQVNLTVTDNQGLTNTFTDSLIISSTSIDTTTDWTRPIAYCKQKFVGCTILSSSLSPNWARYWNQVTPQYLGKWTSTESNRNQMSWSGLDFAWNYSKQNGLLFKGHTFVWGQQIPGWVGGLSAVEQTAQVEQWIKIYCQRYPDYQLIDVVNEPLHETPNYVNAIGGSGASGWDWVVWSFETARKYCPNAKLLINDYYILTDTLNTQKYIGIINILKSRNLIDGIGCQAHHLQTTSNSMISTNLNALQATGLPIYISELDLNFTDDTQQLNRFKSLVPLLYEHPAVKGVTFWGYVKGEQSLNGAWMYDPNGSATMSTSTTCIVQNISSNIALSLNVWQNFTYQLSVSGKIRVLFSNDGAANSQTMSVDYAIIDGVKYEAENMPVNTAVWNGLSCGGSYSQMLHCYGYIEFPSGSQSITICAMAAQGGAQRMTVQLVTSCTSTSSSTLGLPQQRASLKWLKYEYISTIPSITTPRASFKYSISSLTVSLDGTLSTDCDGSIVMYSWSFGDGTSASGSLTQHSYSTAGVYNVQLTVFDNNGKADAITQTITVGNVNIVNQLPTASFVTTVNNLVVSVDGSGSKDADGSISSYSWGWGDSSSNFTGVTASHTYSTAGTYTITLTVTDNSGSKATTTKSVTVSAAPVIVTNTPPVCKFTTTINNLSVNFISTSTDADGTITSYAWNLGNGVSDTNSQFTYDYPTAGTYTVTLTVTDNSGASSSFSQSITVTQSSSSNIPPVSGFGYWTSGRTVNFWFSGYDNDGTISAYQWNFGDGQTSNIKQPIYTYSVASTYVVTLTVVDNLGATGVSSQNVQVSNPIATNFHLQTLTKSLVKIGPLTYGKADVKIFDNQGSPVANVAVSGQISNPSINFYQNISGVTDSSGQVSLITKKGISKLSSINACVWNFNHASLWYNSAENKSGNCV